MENCISQLIFVNDTCQDHEMFTETFMLQVETIILVVLAVAEVVLVVVTLVTTETVVGAVVEVAIIETEMGDVLEVAIIAEIPWVAMMVGMVVMKDRVVVMHKFHLQVINMVNPLAIITPPA
jgi:hypothetical protein